MTTVNGKRWSMGSIILFIIAIILLVVGIAIAASADLTTGVILAVIGAIMFVAILMNIYYV
jgi:hypothetical protein